MNDLENIMDELGQAAVAASRALREASTEQKNKTLMDAAKNMRERENEILAANKKDVAAVEAAGVNDARLDRIKLDAARIAAIADAIEAIAALPDPVGELIKEWQVPSGLQIARRRTPLGVAGIIYESRPNVTADAAALCIKSGNAAILRASSEITHSAKIILDCFVSALKSAELPAACVQLVPSNERAAVALMLGGLGGAIDVIVPRGGKNLVELVQAEARVPVFAHLEGVCHIFIDKSAEVNMAEAVVLNSKMRRPGICGAAETLLVHKDWGERHIKQVLAALLDAGCELRGCARLCALDERIIAADQTDWGREYLDAILAVKIIDDGAAAREHITRYGSGHTEAIIAEDEAVTREFLEKLDSAILMHNCSTQFADGGEFGMGAEIGIATGKFHARGPVGLEQLTSFNYQVRGRGQTRG